MRKRYLVVIGLLIIILALTKGLVIFRELAILIHITTQGLERVEMDDVPAQLWIEVHDVSPGYGIEKLREITNVLDRHTDAADKIVLFVIPNHEGNSPLSAYPDFVSQLDELSMKGYILGVHGYAHRGGVKSPEFKTNLSNAESLVRAAREGFREAGLEPSSYFAPPGWQASREASGLLRREFSYIYYAFYIDTSTGTMPYQAHEYTWYSLDFGGLEGAKKDYRDSTGVFRLAIHLNAANTKENLEFLDEFLMWVEENRLSIS